MKKLILIIVLIFLSSTAFSWPWGEKEKKIEPVKKPEKKYWLIDPTKGVDYVFEANNGNIIQVGVIVYREFKLIRLKPSLRPKSTWLAEGSDYDEKRKSLFDEIRKVWPKAERVKYYKATSP